MADGQSKYQILLTASDKTREAFESAKENTGSLTEKLDIMRGAFAATAVASAVAVAAMVKGSIDAADSMNKAAQKVGTTTEMLSGLKYAADLSDVSFEALQKSLGKLSNNAYLAATSGGAAATAFTTLGISVKGADGHLKDSGTLLEEVAGKFSKMPDSAEKTALAIQMFGKAGMEMIPLLNSGSEGLAKLRSEAEKLGIIIGGETARRAEEFNDNLTRIKKSSEGLANTIMSDLLPVMGQIAQAYADATKDGSSLTGVSSVIKTIFETIVVVGANVAYTFKAIGIEIGGMAAQVDKLAHGDLTGFAAIGKQMKLDAEQARKDIDAFSERVINPPKAAAAADKPEGVLPSLDTETVKKALEALLAKSKQLSDELVISHESAFDKIVTKYVAMDAELTKAGAAGTAQRKALYKSFEAFMADEQAKRTAEIAAAAEKETETNNKLLETQQEKFTKMKEQADQASETGEERENKRYAAQLRELERDRQVLEDKHLSTLESEKQYHAALEALDGEHKTRMSQTSKTFGVSLVQFEKLTATQKTAVFADGLAQMTAVGAQKHRTLFEINKIAGIASATIHGIEAVQSSFKFGASWGGPVGGAAMAAIALASTIANVQAISATEFGGGAPNVGGGGVPSMATSPGIPTAPSSGGGSSFESQQPQAPATTVNIYNTGNVLSADYIDNTIIPQIRDNISNSDVLIIDPRSRQAQVLGAA